MRKSKVVRPELDNHQIGRIGHKTSDKVKLVCELAISRRRNSLSIASLMVAGSVNVLQGA
jgi:hypothetical protein